MSQHQSRSNGWTVDQIRALGTLVDIPTAGSIFGLSRSVAYEAARAATLPVPILTIGHRQWVTVASILARLDVPGESDRNTT